MKFRYIGGGGYLQGLPATDLELEMLSGEQRILLFQGVAQRLYQPLDELTGEPVPFPETETTGTESKEEGDALEGVRGRAKRGKAG